MTVSQATLRDGAELAYRLIPGNGGARFALVHSLAMDRHFWEPVAERLSDLGDVLLYDCRGHGASSRIGAPFTGAQFADDLADLLDAVGWRDAVIAGASMGGCVAIAFAARHPDRTRALGLVDTTAWYGSSAPEKWEERAQKALSGGLEALVDFQKSRWFSQGFAAANPAIEARSVEIFLANDLASYAATCRMLGHFDRRAALPDFAMPTRILVGSEDYATPIAMAEALRDAIPGATMAVIEGAAHLTPLERPDDVAAMLRSLAEDAA
ncbi:alpha/beta fold hydrolase [Sphingomonas koreensis]|nr:alpha/beta fold hydrolase [Sphingomonas koreensis]